MVFLLLLLLLLKLIYFCIDRSIYRPNDEVHIKGYIRWIKLADNEKFEKLGNFFY